MASHGINSPEYLADEFRMYHFKVIECSREDQHDWCDCPFLHPGEKVRRRCPKSYPYSSQACESFRKTGFCKNGDLCLFAHGVFECRLHPQRFKTEMCSDGECCTRRICFFAHSEPELRVLSPRSSFVVNRGPHQSQLQATRNESLLMHSHQNQHQALNLSTYRPQHTFQAPDSHLLDFQYQQQQQQQQHLRPPPMTPGTGSPPSPFETVLPNPHSSAGALPNPSNPHSSAAASHMNGQSQVQAQAQAQVQGGGRFSSGQHELLLYLAEAVQGLLLQSSQTNGAASHHAKSSSQISSNERLPFLPAQPQPQPPPPPQPPQHQAFHPQGAPTPEALAKAVQSLLQIQGYDADQGHRAINHSAHKEPFYSPSSHTSFSPNTPSISTPSPIAQFSSSSQKQTPTPTDPYASASAYVNKQLSLLQAQRNQPSLLQTDSFELLLSQLPRQCTEGSLSSQNLQSRQDLERGMGADLDR